VVVHSYRHQHGLAAGDPADQGLEDLIAEQPPIAVPTVVIDPLRDGLAPVTPTPGAHESHFATLLDARTVQAGHNVPQEAPDFFADAIVCAQSHS
jgi:pimeloyl-ACP methyl ester carboxylesterase